MMGRGSHASLASGNVPVIPRANILRMGTFPSAMNAKACVQMRDQYLQVQCSKDTSHNTNL